MTAVRRKRDDDSTFHSQSTEVLDASQSSMVALDASTVASTTDNSSMPRRRRKRRRTNLVDQLSQIQINHNGGIPNQIPVAPVDDNTSQTLTSSEDEEGEEHPSHGLLSDAEVVQRTLFREFVFGRPPPPPPPNPVERKFQNMVRQSLEQVQKGQLPSLPNANSPMTQDDMTIDPVYSRRSTAVNSTTTTMGRWQRQRSNSLPGDYAAGSTMEIEMEDTTATNSNSTIRASSSNPNTGPPSGFANGRASMDMA